MQPRKAVSHRVLAFLGFLKESHGDRRGEMLEPIGSERCSVLVAWWDWDRARGTDEIPLPHTALGAQFCPQSPRLRKQLRNYLLWLPLAPGMGEGLSSGGMHWPLTFRHVPPAHPPSGTLPCSAQHLCPAWWELKRDLAWKPVRSRQECLLGTHTQGFSTSTNQCCTYRGFSEGFGSTFSQSWAVQISSRAIW